MEILNQDPVMYALPLFIIAMLTELVLIYLDKRKKYEFKDSAASITMGIGSVIIGIAVKLVAFLVFTFLHQYAIFDIGFQWWVWVLLFFADDFSFYWHHRLSHEVRILWAAHVNHHSSVNLNFSTALRQSWTELFYKYAFWLWLPIIGFEPIMILTMMSISLIYQFLPHTEMVGKLAWPIEFIFNTPSHHRVHHSSNVRYLDRNHAGILIIWDRLFGTFQEELDTDKPNYGITVNINTYNPLKIATHEFVSLWKDIKSADSWKDKLGYIFYPPGWSPEGPFKTAKYLQQQLKTNEQNT
ncbi:MAG: sterol desaturase family protein [Chitinophagales bacterium]